MKKYSKVLIAAVSVITVLGFGLFLYAQERDMPISESVKQILNNENIYHYKISKLGSYKNLEMPAINVSVSEDEIKAYILNDLNTFTDLVKKDKDTVEAGDTVTVDYKVYLNNEIINDVKEEIIKVGEYKFNEQFEKSLIGEKTEIEFCKTLYVDDGNNFEYIGQAVEVYITITSIYDSIWENLTDDFVIRHYSDSREI